MTLYDQNRPLPTVYQRPSNGIPTASNGLATHPPYTPRALVTLAGVGTPGSVPTLNRANCEPQRTPQISQPARRTQCLSPQP